MSQNFRRKNIRSPSCRTFFSSFRAPGLRSRIRDAARTTSHAPLYLYRSVIHPNSISIMVSSLATRQNRGEVPKLTPFDQTLNPGRQTLNPRRQTLVMPPHHQMSDVWSSDNSRSPQGSSSSAVITAPAQEKGAEAGNPKFPPPPGGLRAVIPPFPPTPLDSNMLESGGVGGNEKHTAPRFPSHFSVSPSLGNYVPEVQAPATGTIPRPPSALSLEDRLNSAECFDGAWLLMRDSFLTEEIVEELDPEAEHTRGLLELALDTKTSDELAAHNLRLLEDLVAQRNKEMRSEEQATTDLPEEIHKKILSFIPLTSFYELKKTAFTVREGARQSRRLTTLHWFVSYFAKCYCVTAMRHGSSGLFLCDHVALDSDIQIYPWSNFDAEVGFIFQTTVTI